MFMCIKGILIYTYIAYLNNTFLLLVLFQKYMFTVENWRYRPLPPKESINQITSSSEITSVNIFPYPFIVFYDTFLFYYILLYFSFFHFIYEGMCEDLCYALFYVLYNY